jgi:hypothetical protein
VHGELDGIAHAETHPEVRRAQDSHGERMTRWAVRSPHRGVSIA